MDKPEAPPLDVETRLAQIEAHGWREAVRADTLWLIDAVARLQQALAVEREKAENASNIAVQLVEAERERHDKTLAQVKTLEEQNDKLRAKLGNSPEPCAYCDLPAEEQARCALGFPGCSRADDQMMCRHFGAVLDMEAQAKTMRAALADIANRFEDAIDYASSEDVKSLETARTLTTSETGER